MTKETITICHCDICGKKVDKLKYYYYGVIIYEYMRSSSDCDPQHSVECCDDCQNRLNEIIKQAITKLSE